MRKLSTSKDETNTEFKKTEKDVVDNTSVASGQSSHDRESLNNTENSCNDVNQSIELSSEEFQSNNPNTSRNLVEGNDNKQCFSDREFYGDRILRFTPEKNEGEQVIVFVYINICRQSLKFTFSRV